jgi:two-component system sensor histidine kinase UhpB
VQVNVDAKPVLGADAPFDTAGAVIATDTALALYRGAQEGLTNALRHGHATRVDISLRVVDDHWHLEVRDDGRGVGAVGVVDGVGGVAGVGGVGGVAATSAGHYGLRWLAERAEALSGSVALASAAGARDRSAADQAGGACLTLRLPRSRVSPRP